MDFLEGYFHFWYSDSDWVGGNMNVNGMKDHGHFVSNSASSNAMLQLALGYQLLAENIGGEFMN